MKEDCFQQSKEGLCPEVGICTFENKIKGPEWVEQIERWEDWPDHKSIEKQESYLEWILI